MSRNKETNLISFIGAFFIFLVGGLLFFNFIMPIVLPIISWELWLFWLVIGVYFGPLTLLLVYASFIVWGEERINWKATFAGTILAFLYCAGLAFVFSRILPSRFEPFRSVTLPIFILAFTIYFIFKTRFGDWLKRISEVKQE